jgi:hypothetical protein
MRFLIALLCLVTLPAFAGDTTYFSDLPDLPVAPHLVEDADSAVRFDQPEGRIIVLQASGSVQANEINEFYAQTLPALGWKSMGGNRYIRAKEALTLDIKSAGKGETRLNILVKPQ